jgi:hypothetical protein
MVAGGKDHDNNVIRLVETVTVLVDKLDIEDKAVAMSGPPRERRIPS